MNQSAVLNLNDPVQLIPVADKRRKSTFIVCFTLFLICYAFSSWFLTIYSEGDQRHYEMFWRAVGDSYPWQWQTLQITYLSSSDLLYTAIIGFGVTYDLDRITYLSFWNGLLFSTIGYILWQNRASVIFALLVFSNFYILVLLGPAERLKFAYLFLMLSMCFESVKLKIVTSTLSVFCHTQAIVQLISSGVYYILTNYREVFKNKRNVVIALTFIPLFLAALAYYVYTSGTAYDVFINAADIIASKSEIYGDESQGVLEIIQWALILATGLLVFNKKLQFLLSMIPLGILTSLYGSRINVATLAFFCVLAIVQRKTYNPLVLAVMAYMSFKSIDFITRTLATGQGFLGG